MFKQQKQCQWLMCAIFYWKTELCHTLFKKQNCSMYFFQNIQNELSIHLWSNYQQLDILWLLALCKLHLWGCVKGSEHGPLTSHSGLTYVRTNPVSGGILHTEVVVQPDIDPCCIYYARLTRRPARPGGGLPLDGIALWTGIWHQGCHVKLTVSFKVTSAQPPSTWPGGYMHTTTEQLTFLILIYWFLWSGECCW